MPEDGSRCVGSSESSLWFRALHDLNCLPSATSRSIDLESSMQSSSGFQCCHKIFPCYLGSLDSEIGRVVYADQSARSSRNDHSRRIALDLFDPIHMYPGFEYRGCRDCPSWHLDPIDCCHLGHPGIHALCDCGFDFAVGQTS